jgi:23S rRNA pseudouridine1911/1915/1917 synthase
MDHNNSIQENSNFSIQVTQEHAGARIDVFLAAQLPVFSRSLIKKLLTNQQVLINRLTPAKPSYVIKNNDIITLLSIPTPAARSCQKVPKNIGVRIIAEHRDFLIIDKPAGLVVHPPEQTFNDVALTDWLVQEFPEVTDVGESLRPGIVHRLDRNTSGIMIIARTNMAYQKFVQMFKDRLIQKTYIALVSGHPEKSGTIDFAIGRHPVQKNIMHAFTAIPENSCARDAITHFSTIDYFDTFSLVEVKPKTGRTHQIRVHFKAIGHPLMGDTVYGTASKKIGYHALHAQKLEFAYDGNEYEFFSPIDPVLQKIIDTGTKI